MANLLKGVKVIESAMLMTGDFTGQLLADEGADVIKLESPFKGDYLRDFLGQIRPHKTGHSPAHLTLNRNKRSVTVNLKTGEGREIFWKMLADTDVFLDGNTPGAMSKLGVGYEDQRKVKPDIVYAHVTGLGATGPYATVPTHGSSMNAIAATTTCVVNDEGYAVREPSRGLDNATSGVVAGPLYLAFATAAALLRRDRTGQGAYIDVGCGDAVVSHCWFSVVRKLNEDIIIEDQTGFTGPTASKENGSTKYNYYRTKDDKFVLIALIEKHFWENFCRGLGRDDLLEGAGYRTKDAVIDWGPQELRPILRDLIRTKTQVEWMEFARDHDCVIAPANDIADLTSDPHLAEREAVIRSDHHTAGPIWLAGNPIKVQGEHYEVYQDAPALGEHTVSYLEGLGYSEPQLAEWKEKGII